MYFVNYILKNLICNELLFLSIIISRTILGFLNQFVYSRTEKCDNSLNLHESYLLLSCRKKKIIDKLFFFFYFTIFNEYLFAIPLLKDKNLIEPLKSFKKYQAVAFFFIWNSPCHSLNNFVFLPNQFPECRWESQKCIFWDS